MIKIHPRHYLVVEARLEIEKAALAQARKHQLTFIEMVHIYLELAAQTQALALRAERHPNDPDKQGGEA